MRVLIQRVKNAKVEIGSRLVSEISSGMLILVGISDDDTEEDVAYIAKKVSSLRIFDDERGVMNRSVIDIHGDVLSVSQFTLLADTKKGNRPSYIKAAKPEIGFRYYNMFNSQLSSLLGKVVSTGEFGADMAVSLINDGPVTIWIDSKQSRKVDVK